MIGIDLLYVYIVASLAAFFALKRYLVKALKFALRPSGPLYDFALVHFYLPLLIRKRRLWGPITRFQALVYLCYFTGTLVCNAIGVGTLSKARSRAGLLAILHIALLALFPQFSCGATFFNVSLRTYRRQHTLVGLMGVFQSLLHIFLALRTTKFSINLSTELYGLMAIIGMAVAFLVALPWLRHRVYELCMKVHISLGIFTSVGVWLHLKNRFSLDGWLLAGSLISFTTVTIVQLLYQVFRNRTVEQGLAVAKRTQLKDAIKLEFTPTRPWTIRAGQYVYLRVPAVSHFSFAESHPFNILWWEESSIDGKPSSVTILAKIEAGFTRRLDYCQYNSLRVIVDGPYGKPKDTDPYDSFVFVSTGIGITAQLPYLKQLLGRQNRGYRLRRVCLIWQADDKAHDNWICGYMNDLLDLDQSELVLRWALYINSPPPTESDLEGTGESKAQSTGYSVGRRGNKFFGKPDLHSIINDEARRCPTKLLLTVSGDSETREICRNLTISQKRGIDFFETEFQPRDASNGFWAPKVETEEVKEKLWRPQAPPKYNV